ncbi:MAG TPA: ATP phosphoribosyltransferase regulatory subunit [Thermomicrobiales bacterium]|mgnify:CR=1 FL=1|nr:ATP phosphoribosyltransferase regulatory subunit [Thermomicrobiales bacterium]
MAEEASPSEDRQRRGARPVERVRGTHDLLPEARDEIEGLTASLIDNARLHGYQPVETPVIEATELFLRKSGGDRVAQLYSFNYRGRDLALRPEFTASVVRLFVDRLQSEPLPQRLSYAGPVFRYEKPQAGRSRQFTEFGCELIGAAGPVADTEIIALAIEGLRRSGIDRMRLVLGHIGVVIGYLAALQIDQRAQDWLTWSMERLRKGDDAAHELPPHLARTDEPLDDSGLLDDGLDGLSEAAIVSVLRHAGVRFEAGAREPEDIARGLIRKQRRHHDVAVLRDAAAFVTALTRLSGPPAEVLDPLRRLVRDHGLSDEPLDELEQIVGLLEANGFSRDDVTIDLGMGRGLHYYTGMLFEIYAEGGRGPQLCGGGRYDDLAQVLGARGMAPACGFSYGLERVLAASERRPAPASRSIAVVMLDSDPIAALQLATSLRAAGWVATLDQRGRNLSATRRAAQRQGAWILARAVDGGVEVTSLADGAITVLPDVPRPEEVTR